MESPSNRVIKVCSSAEKENPNLLFSFLNLSIISFNSLFISFLIYCSVDVN